MLFSSMFISSYTTTYFFLKKFIFSNVYVPVNTIFECRYMIFGWGKDHQLSTHAAGLLGAHPKCVQLRTRAGGCHVSCARTNLHDLFSCFWWHFLLIMSCFICRNLTLPLFKADMFMRNGYFSLMRLVSVIVK